MSRPVLEINGLCIEGGGAAQSRIVDGLSLKLERGRTIALVGESGAGKSMTSLAVMGLLPDGVAMTGGSILVDGNDIALMEPDSMRAMRNGKVAMIMQNPMSAFDPVFTIRSHFAETLLAHEKGLGRAAIAARATAALKDAGFADPARVLDIYPFQMSGGMLQRVMIALALLGNPMLLIADEATTDLDVVLQKQIVDLLVERRDKLGLSLLLITHDLSVAACLADEVAVMQQGVIIESGSAAEVFNSPRAEYTQRLMRAHYGLYEGAFFTPHGAGAGMDGEASAAPVSPVSPIPPIPSEPSGPSVQPSPSVQSCPADPSGQGHDPKPGEDKTRGGAPLLELREVSREYRQGGGWARKKRVQALDGVSFVLEAGRCLAVAGPSGSGKSTLGRLVLGLERPDSGTVLYKGRDLARLQGEERKKARRNIQVVFQNSHWAVDPRFTGLEIVGEPLRYFDGMTGSALEDKAAALLRRVGLKAEMLKKLPQQYSGGELQRLCLARALAPEPELVVLDEAVSSLDMLSQSLVLDLLGEIRAELDTAFLFITHDLRVAGKIADSLLIIQDGRVACAAELGDTDSLCRVKTDSAFSFLSAAILPSSPLPHSCR